MNNEKNCTVFAIANQKGGVGKTTTTINLSAIELTMTSVMSRELMMRQFVNEFRNYFDYILIDCMPSLGIVTLNALTAADQVIIPVQTQFLPTKGMARLFQTISQVQRFTNPDLKVGGVLLTLVDNRTNLAKSTNAA